eukprot:Em0047g15a
MASPYVTPFYRGKLGIYDYGSRCGSAFPYKLQTGCTWGSAGEDSFMWTHAFLLVYVQPLPSLPTTLRHDFLLVGPPGKDTCQEAMSRMLTLEELTGLTRSWLSRHKATKRELLSLIGKLSFAAKVVPAGRHFLRGLIDLSTTVRKLHHHISLNAEARADIRWWDSFLPSWNGVAMFLDPEWTAADSLQLYTDASGSLGFGAYFNGAWFRGDWQPHQRLPLRSIQWQELFAIVAAASTWGHLWAGLRIHFHCDNLPIVQAWARQSAKHPDLMRLLEPCFLDSYQKKGIMVWAGVFKDQLIGPYFFTRGTVTGEKYIYMLKEVVWPIFEVLFEDDVPHMYYQQDGAPAHYLRGVRDWLNETFGTKWIGRGGPLEWPARSPDLTPMDFWLWGYLKEKVYAHNPKTVDQLQAVIAQERVHWTQQ